MTRIDHQVLSAALATPEDGVPKPERLQPASAIAQIAALKTGERWARVLAPPGDLNLAEYSAKSVDMRENLRSIVTSSVRHAKTKTGGEYSIETGDFISTNRTLYLVCVVTRTD